MRIIILALLFSPLLSVAQKTEVFIKLSDARGQQIKGEAVLKGFERWLQATTITSSGKNNSQLNFTMSISGASADLKRALNSGERLLNGQVTVLAQDITTGLPAVSYTIKMESISVIACTETMGCNNQMITTVTLKAIRIGWTYYQANRTGTTTVSRKFGWDEEANAEWTTF